MTAIFVQLIPILFCLYLLQLVSRILKKIEFETTCTSRLKLCTDCKHMLFPLNFALKWLLLPTLKKGNYSYKTTNNV